MRRSRFLLNTGLLHCESNQLLRGKAQVAAVGLQAHIDEGGLRARAVLEFHSAHVMLQEQAVVHTMTRADRTSPPNVSVDCGEEASKAGAEEAVGDLFTRLVHVHDFHRVRRSVEEVNVLHRAIARWRLRLEGEGGRGTRGAGSAGGAHLRRAAQRG